MPLQRAEGEGSSADRLNKFNTVRIDMGDTKREYWKVEDGYVYGYVETCYVGSRAQFEICELDEAEDMTDEEFDLLAKEALYESGMMDWGY